MRKFLLSIFALLLTTVTFAQTTETFDFTGDEAYGMKLLSGSTQEYNPDPYVCEEGNVTLTLKGRSRWWKASGANELRLYKESSTFTISVPNNYVITNVEIAGEKNFTTDEGVFDDGNWTGSVSSVDFTFTGKSTGKVKSITVTYTDAAADYVAAPTISGETTFEGSTDVTITGVEGSTIYYTLDGSDPTTASTSGASPVTFTLDESATVKAIAVLNGNQSEVATKKFTKVEFTDMTVAEIQELTKDQAYINLTIENGKVVYIDNSYSTPSVYIRDGENAIMFFSTALPFTANATVSGTVKVDYDNYYGIHEVKSNSFTDDSGLTITASDDEAQPITVTIADLLALNHICDLVKIEDVTIRSEVADENTNYYASDGTNEVQFYKNEGVVADYANDGKTYNVTAVFNNIYSGRAEIRPISVELSTGIDNITVEEELDENAPIYNLAGQRVSKDAKGIVIQNGKKYIRR